MSNPISRSKPAASAVADHADDAAGRARQQRVLALEARGPRSRPAVRLHEQQAGPAVAVSRVGNRAGVSARLGPGDPGLDPIDVAAQDRRQVGVDHGGVAPGHQLHQGADLVAGRHLAEAEVAGQAGRHLLVLGVAVAVDERDGHRVEAGVARPPAAAAATRLGVDRGQDLAVGADPLVDLDDLAGTASRAGRCRGRTAPAGPGSRCAASRRKPRGGVPARSAHRFRSSRALVATVVPILTDPMRSAGRRSSAASPSRSRMPWTAASS